jgi:carbon storage regulator
MLILGRRAGESIVLDGGITIVVLACERGGVRLGIQAPADVTILRGEIVQQVEAENRRAPADPEAARAWLGALGATTASAVVEVANVATGTADDADPDPYDEP